LVSFFSN